MLVKAILFLLSTLTAQMQWDTPRSTFSHGLFCHRVWAMDRCSLSAGGKCIPSTAWLGKWPPIIGVVDRETGLSTLIINITKSLYLEKENDSSSLILCRITFMFISISIYVKYGYFWVKFKPNFLKLHLAFDWNFNPHFQTF